LKNENEWILNSGAVGHPEIEWSEHKSQQIATQLGIQLSDAHWEVIRYVRDHLLENGLVRRSRELSSILNARFRKKGGKKYLYRLFHGGPVLKACRLGGVPLPENCVDPSFGTAF
jgi:tRNA 2-thiouridine synthesizing protein E